MTENDNEVLDYQKELLILGHMIKYNLYMLAKSVVFSSIVQKTGNVNEAVEQTNQVISDLDLNGKLVDAHNQTETVN